MPASSPYHMPEQFPDGAAYERAYEFVRLVRDVFHGDPDDWAKCVFRLDYPPRRSTGCCLPPPTSSTVAT